MDDSPADAELCLQELKRAQFAVSADVIQTPVDLAERLRSQHYDLVLSGQAMPGWTGMQVLELLQQQNEQEIPFILVTSPLDAKIMDTFMEKGAFDCVDKNHLVRLPLAVALAVNEKTLREERDRAEKELRLSEAHYRALVENPTFGICRFDGNGRFLDVNQALVTMLGYASREELLAVNLTNDIIRGPAERAQVLESFRQTGRVACIEVEWKRKDGTPMKVRLSGKEVREGHGGPDGCQIIVEDVTKQRALEDQLRSQAARDPLTGLANYAHLVEVLDAEIGRSSRTGREFSLLLLDVDGLKLINDRYGHLTGSRTLCRLANVLVICCRSIDTAARFGGDEFALVLPETGADAAIGVMRRVFDRFANDGEEPRLSVSAGVATYPRDGKTIEDLLYAADCALYLMKGRQHDSMGHGF